MLLEIVLITVGLLVLAGILLAMKYYKQKRSPFYKKKHISFFKRSELNKPKTDNSEDD